MQLTLSCPPPKLTSKQVAVGVDLGLSSRVVVKDELVTKDGVDLSLDSLYKRQRQSLPSARQAECQQTHLGLLLLRKVGRLARLRRLQYSRSDGSRVDGVHVQKVQLLRLVVVGR